MRRLYIEVKKTHLGYELAGHLASQLNRSPLQPRMLLALYVAQPLGRYLEEHGINYLDSVGNCFLCDVGAIVNGEERAGVAAFIKKVRDEGDPHGTQSRMARGAPAAWRHEVEELFQRLDAFERGFRLAATARYEDGDDVGQ